MRQNKHRNAKKAVEFFILNAGFKQPYQVLLDGNFLHTARGFKMVDLQKRLNDLLQGTAKKGLKLSVTPCILAELQSLGADFQETSSWAEQEFFQVDCHHHREPLPPDACIQSIIGEKNGGHYFVASQDLELRRKLGNIVGGATLFISVNGVHISQPTDTQRALAAQLEGSVNQLARTEAKLHVQDVSESMLPNQAELGSEALESLRQMQRPLKTSSKFKKFRKGGPNPLAIKQTGSKKTKRPGPRLRNALKAAALAEQGVQDPKGSEEGTLKKRKKKRKHAKAGSSQAAVTAGPG